MNKELDTREALADRLAAVAGRCSYEGDREIIIQSAAALRGVVTEIIVAHVLAVIDPWTRGAFTGWIGKVGTDTITLDDAEDHFCLCMMDMIDAVRDALEVKPDTARQVNADRGE